MANEKTRAIAPFDKDQMKTLKTHFNEARDALVFMLESSLEQSRRVGLLGDVIKVCKDDYGFDCDLCAAYQIVEGIKATYADMAERTRNLEVAQFMVDAADMKDPYEDLLCFWDERNYEDLFDVIYDTFIYDTIKPMGSKLSQLWSATHEEMDKLRCGKVGEEVEEAMS